MTHSTAASPPRLEHAALASETLSLRHDAQRLLQAAVEQTRDAVLITDACLDKPGPHVVYVNPAFVQMTGYAPAEIVGLSPRILQGPDTNRAMLDRLRKSLASGEAFQGETINYGKGGRPYPVEWGITPIRDQAGEVAFLSPPCATSASAAPRKPRLPSRWPALPSIRSSLNGRRPSFRTPTFCCTRSPSPTA